MIYGGLRNKTGKDRARTLQSQIPGKGLAMRVFRLKRPKSLQEVSKDKTNDVRQNARPEWRSAAAHESVSQ